MPELVSFDYAIVRVVPHVEREEFLNAGVVLYCAQRDYLGAAIALDEERLRSLWPRAEVDVIRDHLEAIPKICAGGPAAGAYQALSRKERWHWLVSPRSTVIQTSAVHSGLCDDPEAALQRILDGMVRAAR